MAMVYEKLIYIWNKIEILKDFRIISYKGDYTEYSVCKSFFSNDRTKFNQWYDDLSNNGKNIFDVLYKLAEDCESTNKSIYVIDIHCARLVRGDENAKEFLKRHSYLLPLHTD